MVPFINKWGGWPGSDEGEFSAPLGIAVDPSGSNVYVADSGNNRIQKFDSDGTFITKWGDGQGSGDGAFNGPAGVAIDASGNVYVAELWNYRIQKFDSDGTFITKWGSDGSGDGQFKFPEGVAIDFSGNVFITDRGNNRIQKFTESGVFLTKRGASGTEDGQFDDPRGIAIDSSGSIFVSDTRNNRIQRFANIEPPVLSSGEKYVIEARNKAIDVFRYFIGPQAIEEFYLDYNEASYKQSLFEFETIFYPIARSLAYETLPFEFSSEARAWGRNTIAAALYQKGEGFEVVHIGDLRGIYDLSISGVTVADLGFSDSITYSLTQRRSWDPPLTLNDYNGTSTVAGVSGGLILGSFYGFVSGDKYDGVTVSKGIEADLSLWPIDISGYDQVNDLKHSWKNDIETLSFGGLSPVDLLITDPSGKRVGVDPTSGLPINEIPGAFASSSTVEPEIITIPAPEDGPYQLRVTGTGDGQFRLIAFSNTSEIQEITTGTISPNQIIQTSYNFQEDAAAPTTTITVDPLDPDGGNGWYNSEPMVSLESIDNPGGSGVSDTEYSLDGGGGKKPTWQSYLNPFIVSTEGSSTILARSTDNAGNIEDPPVSKTILVDKTPPETVLAIGEPKYGMLPYVTSLTPFNLNGTDSGSGLDSVSYQIDDGLWQSSTDSFFDFFFDLGTADGTHTIQYRADDKAGNTETTKGASVFLDNTPPNTTDDVPALWQNKDITITLSPTDTGSGVAATYFATDGIMPTTLSSQGTSISFTNEGIYTLKYFSVDNLGNTENIKTAVNQLKLDKTAPQTSISVGDPNYGTNPTYVVPTTEFSLSVTDNLSGVVLTEYRIDSGSWITYTSLFTVPQEGDHTISYRSTDKAGNVETTQTLTIKVLTNTPGRIVGGGGYNYTSFFNFNILSNGKYPIGTFYYSDRLRGINIWSNVITNLMVFPDKKKAVFIGNVKINGVAGYKFIVYVYDNGNPGLNDKFKIDIYDPSNKLFYSSSGVLFFGNIQIYP